MERVLFIDRCSAAHSQMAEAFLKLYSEGAYMAYSAALEAGTMHPMAVEAMADIDMDLSGQNCTGVADLQPITFDVVITLSDEAQEALPLLSYNTHLHWPIDDPTTVNGSYADVLTAFHTVRDEIWHLVRDWVYNRSHATT